MDVMFADIFPEQQIFFDLIGSPEGHRGGVWFFNGFFVGGSLRLWRFGRNGVIARDDWRIAVINNHPAGLRLDKGQWNIGRSITLQTPWDQADHQKKTE